MKFPSQKNLLIFIALIVLLSVALVVALNAEKAQSRIYSVPFDSVLDYLTKSFGTDVRYAAIGKSGEVRGPHFLDQGTHYFIETETYVPDKLLRFKAWYYQIGGEDYVFTVTKVAQEETQITVDCIIHFFVTIPYCGSREKRILNAIANDLQVQREASRGEQSGRQKKIRVTSELMIPLKKSVGTDSPAGL